MFGGAGRDRLFGDNRNDVLYGEDGNDILVAGSGDDLLSGGAGNNTLIGDRGSDVFVLDEGGFDRILDYEDEVDKFLLGSDLEFEDLSFQRTFFGGVNINSNGQTLANLSSTNINDIDSSDFI